MSFLPNYSRSLTTNALSNTVIVLEALLSGIDEQTPLWDKVVEEGRFTLREILAHLADFEEIWQGRIKRTATEECPVLPNVDESALAIENKYAEQNPAESLKRFIEGRKTTAKLVQSLPINAWDRISIKGGEEWPEAAWVIQVAMHDSYHLAQVSQWIKS